MKALLLFLVLAGTAQAECRVTVENRGKTGNELSEILNDKGYHVIRGEEGAHLVVSIEASPYAWSDGSQVFAYATARIEQGGKSRETNDCPALDARMFSCSERLFLKKAAVECALDQFKRRLPSI